MVSPARVDRTVSDGDPLDGRLRSSGGTADRVRRRWASRRLALGLSPTPRPGLVLLLVGMALGPHGIGVLSTSVAAALDPAVSVALAALGAIVGLDLHVRRPGDARLFGAASVEAAATILVVAAGVIIVHALSTVPEPAPWLLALMLGICAAPSSTAADTADKSYHVLASRLGDLDDVLPIVLGVTAVAWTRSGTALAVAGLIGQGGVIALAIAFATGLLMTQAPSESEQRVFAIGALLLLGGAAAHLSLSALFMGLLAGVFWNVTGTPARDRIERDMRYLQHPLVVLLLVVAGSRLDLSTRWWGLVLAYIVLRIIGKLIGSRLAGRVAGRELPHDVGFSLSAPGVVGIAIALNVLQAGEGSVPGATMFSIVIAGSLGSDLLSMIGVRRSRPA